MANMHNNRQISVASVLLFLLGAFAIDPPEYRCRTQSTRNRQARTVRMDDHDGDHNRWHAHGFDLSGRDAKPDSLDSPLPDAVSGPSAIQYPPQFTTEGLVLTSNVPTPSVQRFYRLRDRAPPAQPTI
jgi:hypothetical protein